MTASTMPAPPPAEACELLVHSCTRLASLAEQVESLAVRVIHGEDGFRAVLDEKMQNLRDGIDSHQALRKRLPAMATLGPELALQGEDPSAPTSRPVHALVVAGLVRQRIVEQQRELTVQLGISRGLAA